MDDMKLWYVCLIIGIVFFVAGLFSFFINRKNKEKAFAKMSILELIAAMVLIFPDVYLNEGTINILVLIKCFLFTFLDVLKIFSGNGYEELVIDGYPVLNTVYVIVLSLVNLSIMTAVIGFILQFLGDFIENTLFYSRKFNTVFIFSEMNEKTLSIAKSIKLEEKKGISKNPIIFIDESSSESNRNKAKEIDAHYTNTPFAKEISKIIKRAARLEVFIFDESEEDNLANLNEFSELRFNGEIPYIRVYAELVNTPWDIYGNFVEHNGLPKDKVIVNLVSTNENFILNDLYENSVFDNARQMEENRIVDVLIVGINSKSIELIKALLPLCQMPGFELRIKVFDDKERGNLIKRIIPELKPVSDEIGDSVYSYECFDNLNFENDQIESMVEKECPRFTFAFVSTDDNVKNINIGLRLNTLRYRLNTGSDYKIQVCVDKMNLIKNWSDELSKNIALVGGTEKLYNYEFITMSKIEKATKAIHDIRQQDKKKQAEANGKDYSAVSWEEYANDEFRRHSVYARTLSLKYKVDIVKSQGQGIDVFKKDDIWKKYEHMRWNMYTRAIGYISAKNTSINYDELNKSTRLVAKVHNCLVPFEELPQEEKEKDSINLTEDIAKVFEGIK
ncbi:MAG: hypothetical protein SPL61_06925 [Saccharofermentans sp.]|nr:hypothetical protein [Saccharofermentans sp.]